MAGTLWSDVESSPWFPDLSPEEKAQTLDNWLGYALEREEDPDKALEISAYAEARKKNFFGESVPQDQIFRPLVERRFDTRQQVSDRYNQFARGELQDPEMEELDQVFKDRADAKVVNGSVFVKPSLIWDEEKYKETVKNSGAPKVEQALALQEFKPLREQASKSMVESLALTDEDFKSFAESGVAAGKSNTAILDEWRTAMKLPEGIFGTIQGIGRQLSYGLGGGLAGLERAGAGVGAILGVPGAQEAAEAAGKEAQSFAARRQVEGGPGFVGDISEGAVSLVPTIAVGAAGAAGPRDRGHFFGSDEPRGWRTDGRFAVRGRFAGRLLRIPSQHHGRKPRTSLGRLPLRCCGLRPHHDCRDCRLGQAG